MASVVADAGTPRTPLEGYEIGQLKLVGIVRNAAGVRAMVEDSQGLGYIVTSGTAIGSAGGIVRAIEERRVLIDETTTNFYGEKQAKEVVMELPQEDRSP
jgi:Tfp pilus assembly protein PilP